MFPIPYTICHAIHLDKDASSSQQSHQYVFYNCISFPYFVEGQIQKLKHSVSKGDKKKKKEVTAQCAILEAELDEKHEKELEEIKSAENEVIDFILFSFLSHLRIKQS